MAWTKVTKISDFTNFDILGSSKYIKRVKLELC